jgi:hypothetical protein
MDTTMCLDARVPTAALLDAWSSHQWTEGLQVETLPPLQPIEVRTRNTIYRIVVIEGQSGDVLILGGRFFPTQRRARLNGCTLGGCCLKQRGLYCGFNLELQIGREVILTTPVQSIALLDPADVRVH